MCQRCRARERHCHAWQNSWPSSSSNTFGLKAAVWLDELRRQLIRLDEAAPRIAVGKFLGAVGTGAAQGEHARELQRLIMTHLGLGVPLATTQVVGRDRYIEYVSWLANVAATCEKILQEIRNLQKSEIQEAGEGFDVKKQVGSSTMAHKRTPLNQKMLQVCQDCTIYDNSNIRKCLTVA